MTVVEDVVEVPAIARGDLRGESRWWVVLGSRQQSAGRCITPLDLLGVVGALRARIELCDRNAPVRPDVRLDHDALFLRVDEGDVAVAELPYLPNEGEPASAQMDGRSGAQSGVHDVDAVVPGVNGDLGVVVAHLALLQRAVGLDAQYLA